MTEYEKLVTSHKERLVSELGSFDVHNYTLRHELCTRFSWAIPSEDTISKIKSLDVDIVEMGAGSGYWAFLLAEAGVEIIAYDRQPYSHTRNDAEVPRWYPVHVGSVEKISNHPDRALLLVWPSYDTSFATSALDAFKGDTLIYVGEYVGGCTADDAFFEQLSVDFEEPEVFDIPQWWGINDAMFIYKRKQ